VCRGKRDRSTRGTRAVCGGGCIDRKNQVLTRSVHGLGGWFVGVGAFVERGAARVEPWGTGDGYIGWEQEQPF